MNRRTLLFLYSDANIAGSALGILGVLIYFVLFALSQGAVTCLFLFVVPGLYAIGWLALWLGQSPATSLRVQQQLTAEEITQALEALVNSIRHRVSKDILSKVESIKNSILHILPSIVDANSADHAVYTIRQTAFDYLPETLENYLKLPKAFANIHPVRDGKTAHQLLLEQLDVLEREMKEIEYDFYRSDTQRLLAHGRFLEDKFQDTELWFADTSR